jgi:hypothetical protein
LLAGAAATEGMPGRLELLPFGGVQAERVTQGSQRVPMRPGSTSFEVADRVRAERGLHAAREFFLAPAQALAVLPQQFAQEGAVWSSYGLPLQA